MISYGRQSINQDDIDAVAEVLKSDFITQGPKVLEFENHLANYCNAKYAKVVSHGTAALHLAYLAVGLKQNDLVWTVPNTFVATANAALYCGAKVDFVDIDLKTYNLSIDSLKNKLFQAKKDNKLPNLVVPVHFAGQSCEMRDIWELSKEFGFKVIEDASHALGGEYLENKVGSCQYSDMAVFSFHPVKMITTGEGGAIMTNNEQFAEKIELLRTHGITKDAQKMNNKSHGIWYYEQQDLGFNYRLTDIQAALGISQLKRLDSFVNKRQEIANQYIKGLHSDSLNLLPYQHPDVKPSWHLFVITTKKRKMLFDYLRTMGVGPQVHYIQVTDQPFYKRNSLRNSASFYKECLSLPIYYDLSKVQTEKVISSYNSFR